MLNDGIKKLIDIGVNRNLLVYDADAPIGIFTPRLVCLVSNIMSRQNRNGYGKLTDMIISPEAYMNLLTAQDTHKLLLSYLNVNFHTDGHFGEGNDYNNYYINDCKGSFPNDIEIGIGLDLRNKFSDLLNGNLDEVNILLFSY